jgi:acyl-CoA synthetase (AMP-forming)/AMP-acid ligase II
MRHHGARLSEPVDVREILARGLELYPNEPALVTGDGRWSWRELEDATDAYAANLTALGLAAGDRIASLLPNCGALFIHYLGTFKAGLVAVPLN